MPNPDKGYRLPAVIDPPRLCVLLHIPNDPQHIRAFWGALNELTYWFNWERDATHLGTQAANIWQDIIDTDYQAWVTSVLDACGEANMDCTDLGNCIENDPTFIALLQNMVDNAVNTVQPTPNAPMADKRLEENLMPDDVPNACDKDHVFGIVTALVDGIHQTCVDFLEIIELITDPAEIAAELTDNAGIFTAGASSALDIANWLNDTIRDVYLAKYTSAVRDQIRCALFCNAKEGCSLSIDDIFSTYRALAGALTQGFGTFDDAAATIIQITDQADLIVVSAFHLLVCTILRYGSDFVNLTNFNALGLIMQLAENNPDSDHEILCTTCVDLFWLHDASFGLGLKGWQVLFGLVEGGRIRSGTTVGNEILRVVLQFPESMKIRGCEIHYQRVSNGNGAGTQSSIRLRPIIGSDVGSNFIWIQGETGGSQSFIRCGVRTTLQGTFLTREIVVSISAEGPSGDIYLDRVRVWGEVSPIPENATEESSQPQCTP